MNFFTKLISGNKFNLIPIITRIFIFFVIGKLSFGNQIKYKLLLSLLSFFVANMLKLSFPSDPKDKCTSENTKPIGAAIEQLLNSIIQYGFAFLIPKLFIFIPVVGLLLRGATKIPILGGIVDFIYWILGFRFGNTVTTSGFKLFGLIPIGETDGSGCSGKIGFMKKFIAFLCFLAILFIEVFGSVKDNLF